MSDSVLWITQKKQTGIGMGVGDCQTDQHWSLVSLSPKALHPASKGYHLGEHRDSQTHGES